MRRTFLACFIFILAFPSLSSAQWAPLERISYARGGNNPHIKAQGDTLHVVYQGIAPYGGVVIWHVASLDGGASWGAPQIVSDTARTNSTAFPKVVSRGRKVGVFWHNNFINQTNRDNIGFRLSTNNGQSWGQARYLLSENAYFIDYFDVCSEDSVIDIVYTYSNYGPDGILFRHLKSTNFGTGWSEPPDTICRTVEIGRMDLEKKGERLNVVFDGCFDHQDSWEVYHIRSTDGGGNWSGIDSLTSNDGIPSQFSKLCAREGEELLAIWTDFAPGPTYFTGDILMRRSDDGGLSWTPSEQLTFTYYALQADIATLGDSIFLAWTDERHHSSEGVFTVYSIHSTDDGLTWSPELRLEPERYDAVEPSLASSDGKARLVFKGMRCLPDTDYCGGAFYTEFPAEPDGIRENKEISLPEGIRLRAYPNPFNSSTTITVSGMEKTEIVIYDITGRRLDILQAHDGRAVWEASTYSSGVYFARVVGEKSGEGLRLVLVR